MSAEPNTCFGCGPANPRGMRLVYAADEARQRIVGRFVLGPEYQGGPGFVHGGIVAVLLDEAMGKACRFSGGRTVTASLAVEYRKPVPVGTEIVVEGYQVSREGRSLHMAGEIRRADGRLLARGRGRFVVIDPEQYRAALQREAAPADPAPEEKKNATPPPAAGRTAWKS